MASSEQGAFQESRPVVLLCGLNANDTFSGWAFRSEVRVVHDVFRTHIHAKVHSY